ncbi:hypothetical protein E2K80_02795 [Rhodophyticola sp. CCM32]|nr:hypothetical protein E2K80_02795 [Rhodophyticola sp. CCM32]
MASPVGIAISASASSFQSSTHTAAGTVEQIFPGLCHLPDNAGQRQPAFASDTLFAHPPARDGRPCHIGSGKSRDMAGNPATVLYELQNQISHCHQPGTFGARLNVNTVLSALTRRIESLNHVADTLWLEDRFVVEASLPVTRYEWLNACPPDLALFDDERLLRVCEFGCFHRYPILSQPRKI